MTQYWNQNNIPSDFPTLDEDAITYGLIFLYGDEQRMQNLEEYGWRYLATIIPAIYPEGGEIVIAVYANSSIGKICVKLGNSVEYDAIWGEIMREKEREGWIRLGQPRNTTGPIIVMRFKKTADGDG